VGGERGEPRAVGPAKDSTAHGQSVSYLRTMFAPDDGGWLCLFEAERAEDVRRVSDTAGIAYGRVMPALQLDPPAG
jgi:hypothetical protein